MNNTVKRKFNALLQGIGNRPSSERSDTDHSAADSTAHLSSYPTDYPASSPASQRSSLDLSRRRTMASDSTHDLHKKRRVGGPAATPTKYTALQQTTPMRSSPASIRSVPSTTISNVTLRKWTPGGAASPAPDARDGQPPPPKYCPGDRDQLLRRLATFQELTDWTPKPDRVSEIEWAKRGWVCQGKERVRCTLCARELVVKVNRKEVDGKELAVLIASEIAESVVDKYAELIVDSHAEDCLWRRKGCDGESALVLRLPKPQLTCPPNLQTLSSASRFPTLNSPSNPSASATTSSATALPSSPTNSTSASRPPSTSTPSSPTSHQPFSPLHPRPPRPQPPNKPHQRSTAPPSPSPF